MLDIKKIKEDPDKIKEKLKRKELDCNREIDRILTLDKERRDIIFATEQMKAEQNKVSKSIPQMKKAGEDTAPVFQRMAELKAVIAANDEKLRRVDSIAPREEAMLLKAMPRRSISVYPSTGMRMVKSPLIKLWVASTISRRGRTRRLVTK